MKVLSLSRIPRLDRMVVPSIPSKFKENNRILTTLLPSSHYHSIYPPEVQPIVIKSYIAYLNEYKARLINMGIPVNEIIGVGSIIPYNLTNHFFDLFAHYFITDKLKNPRNNHDREMLEILKRTKMTYRSSADVGEKTKEELTHTLKELSFKASLDYLKEVSPNENDLLIVEDEELPKIIAEFPNKIKMVSGIWIESKEIQLPPQSSYFLVPISYLGTTSNGTAIEIGQIVTNIEGLKPSLDA